MYIYIYIYICFDIVLSHNSRKSIYFIVIYLLQVYHLASVRLTDLCSKLGISAELQRKYVSFQKTLCRLVIAKTLTTLFLTELTNIF